MIEASEPARHDFRFDGGGRRGLRCWTGLAIEPPAPETDGASMVKKYRPDTVLAHGGRDPGAYHGSVNPPVYHTSTFIFPTVEALEAGDARPYEVFNYGRVGTPTVDAFERAMTELEGGHRAVATASGLAAVTLALTAFLKAGDHLLMTDNAYRPTRLFCETVLGRFGVETTFYDPLAGDGIAGLIRDNTKVLYLESPGSLTFEVQDVPAMARAAKAAGATVLMDNTWATPLLFRPIEHGVDVSIQAATKYVVGHADASLGVIICADDSGFRKVKRCATIFGNAVGSEEAYFGLRGLRTMGVRLHRHQENALAVATWLQGRPEVARLLYPALPGDPGYALWQRDFSGASGLFGVVLADASKAAVSAMLDGMALFAMGASWGGFESLILPTYPSKLRTATRWDGAEPCLRLHVGLEDPADLIDDLAAGLDRLSRAMAA